MYIYWRWPGHYHSVVTTNTLCAGCQLSDSWGWVLTGRQYGTKGVGEWSSWVDRKPITDRQTRQRQSLARSLREQSHSVVDRSTMLTMDAVACYLSAVLILTSFSDVTISASKHTSGDVRRSRDVPRHNLLASENGQFVWLFTNSNGNKCSHVWMDAINQLRLVHRLAADSSIS